MKFVTRFNWNLRTLTKEVRARREQQLQQQQQFQQQQQRRRQRRQQRQRQHVQQAACGSNKRGAIATGRARRVHSASKDMASGGGTLTVSVLGFGSAQLQNRKAQLIKDTCAEFVAQMELLHSQLDKQPPMLLAAECFAVMPVKGVTAPHPHQLTFSWFNARTWYSIAFVVMTLIDLGLAMYKVLNATITFDNIEPLIFRLSILVVCINAISLARKWPALMLYWADIEGDLPAYVTQMEKGRLAYRIKMVTAVAVTLSLGEHLLNLISNIQYSTSCPKTSDPIENFFLITNQQIFYVFTYSPFLAIWGKVQNVMSTFIWNYMDVFVMVVSLGLAAKFKQLNENLIKFKGMQMPECFWTMRRKQYRQLCELCARVDSEISIITIISFSNNLYFICVQLLRSLNKMPSFAHAAYFYFSLFFLIGRTLAVSLYAASIHDESRKPLRVLRCVPKESWCVEVKRFSEEINSDLVALSGMKFFYLTRKLVLSVAGTIVTYELVLIQFHQESNLADCTLRTGNTTRLLH